MSGRRLALRPRDDQTSWQLIVSPPVALAIDVSARILTEVGRADDEDLEALRPGLVASPSTGGDAHRVPLLELDDFVVDLQPAAPAEDHVHLLLLLVRMAVRKAIARRDALVAQGGALELERLGRGAELQVRRTVESRADVLQILLDVPERERHVSILRCKSSRTGDPSELGFESRTAPAVSPSTSVASTPGRPVKRARCDIIRVDKGRPHSSWSWTRSGGPPCCTTNVSIAEQNAVALIATPVRRERSGPSGPTLTSRATGRTTCRAVAADRLDPVAVGDSPLRRLVEEAVGGSGHRSLGNDQRAGEPLPGAAAPAVYAEAEQFCLDACAPAEEDAASRPTRCGPEGRRRRRRDRHGGASVAEAWAPKALYVAATVSSCCVPAVPVTDATNEQVSVAFCRTRPSPGAGVWGDRCSRWRLPCTRRP